MQIARGDWPSGAGGQRCYRLEALLPKYLRAGNITGLFPELDIPSSITNRIRMNDGGL